MHEPIDFAKSYILVSHAVCFVMCLFGAFNSTYNANAWQRLAIGIFGIWCASRVYEILTGHPWVIHEYVISTAFLIMAAGTACKIFFLCKRRDRRSTDKLQHGN